MLSHFFVLVRDPFVAWNIYPLQGASCICGSRRQTAPPMKGSPASKWYFSPQSCLKLELSNRFLLPSLQHGPDGESSTELV